jgi:NADH-quinone oxidoreductase subunit E
LDPFSFTPNEEQTHEASVHSLVPPVSGKAFGSLRSMERIAIPIFESRVSPVLDVCNRMVVVDIDGTCEVRRDTISLGNADLAERIEIVAQRGIHKIICGGISDMMSKCLAARNIILISGIAGELEKVIRAFVDDKLDDACFNMPGKSHDAAADICLSPGAPTAAFIAHPQERTIKKRASRQIGVSRENGGVMQPNVKDIDTILESCPGEPRYLISLLQDVQAEFNFISEENLTLICDHVRVSLPQAWSVATFYKSFSLKPRGEHEIKVCLGTACHLKGGQRLVDNLSREMGVAPGETTPDLRFTLDTVNCLGACALAPVAVVKNEYHSQATSRNLNKIIKKLSAE